MNIKEDKKGITLIALVITIIVLLILAGISITMLAGENGIITKAGEAKTKTGQATEKELIELAVMNSMKEDATIDKDKLQEELNNIPDLDLDTNYTSKKWKATGKNTKIVYEIDIENGKVSSKEVFDPEEWDKTAAPEDCFLWESDREGTSGYNTIVGYTEKVQAYTKLRYPSRCKEVRLDFKAGDEDKRIRSFTNVVKVIELPDTVTSIGKCAFGNLGSGAFTELKEVNVPAGVVELPHSVFDTLRNLRTVELNEGLDTMGKSLFQNCSGLTQLRIPDSVTRIEDCAFEGCTGLTTITIPKNVEYVNASAFEGWTDSQTIRIEANTSGWDSHWDEGCGAKIVYAYVDE